MRANCCDEQLCGITPQLPGPGNAEFQYSNQAPQLVLLDTRKRCQTRDKDIWRRKIKRIRKLISGMRRTPSGSQRKCPAATESAWSSLLRRAVEASNKKAVLTVR